MNFLNYQSCLRTLFKKYKSCSVVNSEGALLYSKDMQSELLTTTRLVAFQIVKKYLNPKPQDLFILNDPENGGYQYSKLIFITCLHPNLFLIWDEDYFHIDFKIPPTPLFDQGKKNEFVWQALISSHPYAEELESFFEYQKCSLDKIVSLTEQLKFLADTKNQQVWLKSTQEIFRIQFNNKSNGSFETQFKANNTQSIKLRFSAEEKQNILLITLDFTNTNLATDFHASSHVIESSLIKKIIDYYQIGDYFTQSILDKIKVILPPKSIVSKPHPTGDCNFELQTLTAQLCDYNMQQLNAHTRKNQTQFEYINFLNFEMSHALKYSNNLITQSASQLNNFEDFIEKGVIKIKKMRRQENTSHLIFEVLQEMNLKVKNNYSAGNSGLQLKINNAISGKGYYKLSKQDLVEITAN